MHLLCVGRHGFLADHIAAVFRQAGGDTRAVVGLAEAAELALQTRPDIVLCDYDLLATNPLGAWESDPILSRTPVVAVSLTRRPQEACAFDVNGIAGFLYLPTLDHLEALRTLRGLVSKRDDRPAAAPAAAYPPPVRPADAPAGMRA